MTKKFKKFTPSDMRVKAERLIATGKMPTLSDVVAAIREVKKNPEFVVPVVNDALMREKVKGDKQ
jgi:HD-like signal output (HDOD) protein